jgi:uncharacterized membrane-anchored protein YjiN (DUF445 family)
MMRLVAGALLALMAALLVVARRMDGNGPAWGYAAAFAEAALVGGLADWFAVTALFRRPLGLPIPHTAIIPSNKDRIADSMAAFLRANFLTPTVIARRLHRFDPAQMLGRYLTDSTRRSPRIGDSIAHLLADVLESLDPDKVGRPARAVMHAQVQRVDVAPLAGQALAAMIADGRHAPLIDALLRRTGALLEMHEPTLRVMISDRAGTLLRWTRLDDRLANALLDAVYALLAEMLVEPDHPLRTRLDQALADLAQDLRQDPAMAAKVARIKQDVLANPAFAQWLDGLWERGRLAMIANLRAPGDPSSPLGGALGEFGHALGSDPALRRAVNRFARRSLAGLASRHGDGIVRVVSETVRRWDARTVSARIERAVGRDLQYIRFNGTLVGGLVGLALHAAKAFV